MNGNSIESRIAHFFAYDDDGLYFRTMNTKPFYKQLREGKTVSVCGMYPTTQVTHDENNLPFFEPGYTMRITDRCVGCGKCAKVCTFDAIQPGEQYSIRGNRCDECGNCYTVCPVRAIQAKGQ